MSKSELKENKKKFLKEQIKKQMKIENIISSDIFDSNFITHHLICRICKCVLLKPVQCPECEENFCSSCFMEFSQENKYCINSCTVKESVKTHVAVINFLEKLKFKCIGNNEEINYVDIVKHLTETCEYKQSVCPNLNCDFVSRVEEAVEYHLQTCENSLQQCVVCNVSYRRKESHDCSHFFLRKIEETKEIFKQLKEDYTTKLKELNNLAEYIEMTIKERKDNKIII
jgi:hypothetical protein